MELGIRPDIRLEVIQNVEICILGERMPDALSLETRYMQGTAILSRLFVIQKEIRQDVCAFLRRRMNNQRGLKEHNKLLEEIKIVDGILERLKSEVKDKLFLPTEQVTGEMAVLVRSSLNTLKRIENWGNV
jgi:hypothetical protein